MAEYKQPTSEVEFEKNFEQLKPLMSDTQAYYESSRCLFCYDAPCVNACPTGIDIPMFIRQINNGNEDGAAKTIYDSNYFGYSCGKVCPTEVLCEGACVYNHQDVHPIEIGRLQSFATGKAIENNVKLYAPTTSIGKKVGIIGAGPAGISCACALRSFGIDVEIFEAKEKPTGLLLHGVAPYKITNKEVHDEISYLQNQFGFVIHYNTPIQTKEEIDQLNKSFDAVFIGVGLGETSETMIPGEALENCMGAVEFVAKLRMTHHKLKVPNRVVVLGGGNTAMDAASESARMGAEKVILAYRRGKEEMKAYDFEYELAKSVGVKGMFNVQPIEILGKSKVESVQFIRTQNLNGKLVIIPNSEFTIACDWIIKATGQSKQVELFQHIPGLTLDDSDKIKVDKDTLQTSNPRYFAAGDCVSGGQEVVNAVADGKKAALGIYSLLKL